MFTAKIVKIHFINTMIAFILAYKDLYELIIFKIQRKQTVLHNDIIQFVPSNYFSWKGWVTNIALTDGKDKMTD